MFSCCGDAKEDSIHDTTSNKAKTATPRGPTYGAGGSTRGDPRSSGAVRTGAPQKTFLIEVPNLSLAELNTMTGNFGSCSFIRDGSYCQVYHGTLSNGQEAIIKKLDTSSSPEPDSDFTNQLSVVSRLKNEYFVALLGYCLEENNRILVEKVWKGLSLVLFSLGPKELKLLMVQQEVLIIYMKRFNLRLFIVIFDPAMCYYSMIFFIKNNGFQFEQSFGQPSSLAFNKSFGNFWLPRSRVRYDRTDKSKK